MRLGNPKGWLQLTLSELIRMLGDVAEVAVTILLLYLVYRMARLVGTLDRKIGEERPAQERMKA